MAGEWSTASLGELCEFRTGSVFKPALQGKSSGEFPFVKVSDMNLPANAVHIQDANNWVSAADIRELRAKPLPPGTVVFAKIGEALRQNRLRQVARETVVDNNMMGAVPRIDRIDPRFFYYALSRFDFSDIAQGTAVPYLTVASLSAVPLDVPPPAEQRAIAHILGTLDDKIELNRRMSETLESMARALFKSWFVDFDPVRAKSEGRDPGLPQPLADLFPDRLVGSDFGEIPVGWRVGALGDVVDLLRDREDPRVHPEAEFVHFSIPAFDDGQRPVHEPGSKIQSLKSQVPPDVVLLSKLNPRIERVWIVDVKEGQRAVASTEFLVLRPRRPAGRVFLYGLCRSASVREGLVGLATGTSGSHQRANTDAVLRIPGILPPEPILTAYERLTAVLVLRWLAAVREAGTLEELRDALLPRLVSGQLRVDEADALVGGAA